MARVGVCGRENHGLRRRTSPDDDKVRGSHLVAPREGRAGMEATLKFFVRCSKVISQAIPYRYADRAFSASDSEPCPDQCPTQNPQIDPTHLPDSRSTDIVLISSTGEKYLTDRNLLRMHSPVLNDMFQFCNEPVSSAAADNAAGEVRLPDTSTMIYATVKYLDDPEDFLSRLRRDSVYERIRVLENLVSFAHKYDMQGKVPRLWQCRCTKDGDVRVKP
jgi:hypothetical protein